MPSLGSVCVCLQRWLLLGYVLVRLTTSQFQLLSRSVKDSSMRQCLRRSTEVRCEFFRSLRILEDLECNFWKTDVKSCSGKTVLMTPSRITMTSLLFKLGNWSISKSIARPALLVSLPITLLSSSDKLEKRAALAATHVRCFWLSSLTVGPAGGQPPGQRWSFTVLR